jgi:hypothetical protein
VLGTLWATARQAKHDRVMRSAQWQREDAARQRDRRLETYARCADTLSAAISDAQYVLMDPTLPRVIDYGDVTPATGRFAAREEPECRRR